MSKISKEEFLHKMAELGRKFIEENHGAGDDYSVEQACCNHEYKYLGGHNEWWFCSKCGHHKR